MITAQLFLSRFRKYDKLIRKSSYKGDDSGYRYYGSRSDFEKIISQYFNSEVELQEGVLWSRSTGGASDKNPTGILLTADSRIKIVFNKTCEESGNILSGQKLSYLAECAVAASFGHIAPYSSDARLQAWYSTLDYESIKLVDSIYLNF